MCISCGGVIFAQCARGIKSELAFCAKMFIMHIMNAETPPISAVELKQWRLLQKFSQEEVGAMLGVSHSAVNRWEKGGENDQDIPGPADKLLRMLIRGEMPLELPAAGLGAVVREDIGAVEMTVDAFEECLRRARAAGFGSVTEWIAALVRSELGAKPDGETRRLGEGEPLPERQAVVYETPKRGRKAE